ncbi:MAG: SGNH/GDSL hydrolase family protein [Anaerolineae bacterium]|nr:SGNH/GDSL hydrolase family protein [Anaerolineae bacterium]
MTRRSAFFLVILLLLAVALAGSLLANHYLFTVAAGYYLQLNQQRLDPLALSALMPTAPPLQSGQQRLVLMGDSRAQDWPMPPALPQFQFINRGIGGQTTAQIVGRFDAHVAPLRPQVLLLQLGVNDLKTIPMFPDQRATIVADVLVNTRQMVDQTRAWGGVVILTTIFPVTEASFERRLFFWSDDVSRSIQEVNQVLRSRASESILVLDAHSLLLGADGLTRPEFALDTLHLNAAGYAHLNTALRPILTALSP